MPRQRGTYMALCFAAAAASACSGKDSTGIDIPDVAARSAALQDMTPEQAAEDLEQIFTSVESLYGPYEYKEERFGYSIAALEDEARTRLASAPGDDGFHATATWFLTRLHDGHVGLGRSQFKNPISTYWVGLWLTPVQGHALVAELIDPSLAALGISQGDEVVAIDGVPPHALLDEIKQFDTFGNEVTDEHLLYLSLIRPSFVASLRPTAPTTRVEFVTAGGTAYSRDLTWRQSETQPVELVTPAASTVLEEGLTRDGFLSRRALQFNEFASGALNAIGAEAPFFLTGATAATFDITPVTPSAEALASWGLNPSGLPGIYSALYTYAGKTFLLLRQNTYDVSPEEAVERLFYYRAIMDQYDGFVDGLVLDQTHNPGGSVPYALDFFRLFTSTPARNLVQAMNTDRRWMNFFQSVALDVDPSLYSEESRAYLLRSALIEAAYDAGESITVPMPLLYDKDLPPDDYYVWHKPLLVLIDELAGSCGDVVPMLFQENGVAPLFGRRTIGLGGNVEEVARLANSDAPLSLTRGLSATHREDGAYTTGDFIENTGVEPDIEHIITVDDFRGGFVDYMTHFSAELAARIDAASQPPAAPTTESGPAPE